MGSTRFLTPGLVALSLMASVSAANAQSFINPGSAFNDLSFKGSNATNTNYESLERFVAEGRMGVPGPGDYEYMLRPSVGNPTDTGHKNWTSGQNYAFTLTHNHNTGLVTFTLAGGANGTLTETFASSKDTSDLFLRIYGGYGSGRNTGVRLSNIVFTSNGGSAVLTLPTLEYNTGLSSANAARPFYYRVTGIRDSFSLTGNAALFFNGTYAQGSNNLSGSRSNPAFQFKAVSVPAVPEPGEVATFSALFATVGALIIRKRIRRSLGRGN